LPVYVVTYDLIAKAGEKRDYQPIWDAIGQFPNHEVLYSVFLVEAPSAVNVEETIKPALRKDDRYFVTRLRKNEHRYRAMPGTNQWLADHPPG
jgi:hypothetical protein